jgi:hypothetical protein
VVQKIASVQVKSNGESEPTVDRRDKEYYDYGRINQTVATSPVFFNYSLSDGKR